MQGIPPSNALAAGSACSTAVGHGLGLDLHESPRFAAGKLFAGLSITVEPVSITPASAAVRIEDVVIVGKTGVRNLNQV